MERETDPRLIRLGPEDNVLVLATSLSAVETVRLDGEEVRLTQPLTLGHKIAACGIAEGETIVKYGAPIGVATQAIGPGEHVHVQNMRSNYTPSYVLPEADP
ncbi:MAG: UxaA family hydrolase [Paracoccaceae bacterium]|nr:UxaA family hydrolase [Paracoccaceae bacterium]